MRRFMLTTVLGLAAIPSGGPAAADSIWTGGGKTDAWDDAGNWNNGVPASDKATELVFSGMLRTTNSQNISNPFVLNKLTFTAGGGAFVIQPFLRRGLEFDGTTPMLVQKSNADESIETTVNLKQTLTVAGDGKGVVTLTNVVSGAGGLTKDGTSTLRLGGDNSNTYAGTTTVADGALLLNKSEGRNAIAGPLVIGNGAGTGKTVMLEAANQIKDDATVTIKKDGVLDLNNHDERIGVLVGDKDAKVKLGDDGGNSLKTGGAGENKPFAGSIVGAGSLVKEGNNVLALTGDNSYSGITTVRKGTLKINGQGVLSSTKNRVTVDKGATLGGTGKILSKMVDGGGVTINKDGTIRGGGGGIGTLHVADVTLESRAIYLVEIDHGLNSRLDVSGQIDLGGDLGGHDGGLLEFLIDSAPNRYQSYDLIHDESMAALGTFNGLADGSLVDVGGTFFRIDYEGGANHRDVVLEPLAVPEPGTLTLVAIGTLALLPYARKGRRVSA